jgi:hypothetical protein
MILANFCRNCLSKWYMAAAQEQGETLDYEKAREIVYGMPYSEWKENISPQRLKNNDKRWPKNNE